MPEENFAQIAFMPYASVKESFSIGNYEVWAYYKEAERRIKNQNVIQHLNQIFSIYFERKYDKEKGGYDKPLEEIFIISPHNFQFGVSKFSDDQIEDIRTISHIIAFCAINESFSSSLSDEFKLYIQNFQVGSDGIAIWRTIFKKLEMVKFMKPYYLNIPLIKFEKNELCDALGKSLQFKNRKGIKKIFRALELFYYTTAHGEMLTDEHRLLSLVMCFEVLLDFGGKKLNFANKIEKIFGEYYPKETHPIKENNKDVNKSLSKTAWWAFDLYKLRNDIIHGNEISWEIKKYGDILKRIEFGRILLRKLIKKTLIKESLFQPDYFDNVLEVENLDEKLEDLCSGVEK